jgi:streptogramin lyase
VLIALLAVAAAVPTVVASRAWGGPSGTVQEGAASPSWQAPRGVAEIPYDADADVLKWPEDLHPGEIAGVARNSRGDFYVFSRGRETQLFEFDKSGHFRKEIGKNLYGFDFAHSLRVDAFDNIWAVDEGASMVIKFNPQGRVVLTLGRKWERVEGRPRNPGPGDPPPTARPNVFNRPTDVAWDRQGNAYISDGHNNSRVVKIGPNGEWLLSWGRRGSAPGDFNLPHTIAVDSKDRVYVGDYGNSRIQVFDTSGRYLKELSGFGHPSAICMTPPPNEYLFTSDGAGHFYKVDLDGRILGWFGKWGKRAGEFNNVRGLHCQNEHELYTGETENWRVQRLRLHPLASDK